MKTESAFCTEFDREITISAVRELQFDEEIQFNHKDYSFFCPNDDCGVVLTAVNASNYRFKVSPHFRAPDKHRPNCAFHKKTSSKKETGSLPTQGYISIRVPNELVLKRENKKKDGSTRRPKLKKKKIIDALVSLEDDVDKKYKTSLLAAVVDTYEEHRSEIADVSLKIGKEARLYPQWFKNVNYFYEKPNCIYKGPVSRIKQFKTGYAVWFEYPAKFEGKSRPISIFLGNDQIASYRKSKVFKVLLEDLMDVSARNESADEIWAYIYGSTPELSDAKIKVRGEQVHPLSIKVGNLDYLYLRTKPRDIS